MFRSNNRKYNEIRPMRITRNYIKYAEGSTLMEMGSTKIICTASVEDKVPLFLRGKKSGWISAEYSMIPRANQIRNIRDSVKGKISGRSSEIQRLIGRSLRSVVDMVELGERTIWIDCDVVQADGGTRTSAIIGSFIALFDALTYLRAEGHLDVMPIKDYIGAISAGIVDGEMLLDLNFEEDSHAQVDLNMVMTAKGEVIEIQGTAEGKPFSKMNLQELIKLAETGIKQIIEEEKNILGEIC
ncbi:MAG: ribonuclease PH [Candidatus Atribacteria bacterium]|nr:ribonuclease PH [Candidatus Atribacteria bacterium]MBE3092721.1 ribonuclease PH [Chloroflexota bacterium]